MKRFAILLLALVTAPVAALAADPAAEAQKVTECLRANVPPHLTIGQLELTAYDKGGSARTLKGRLYVRKSSKGLLQASLRVDAPGELKGAAYLVQETQDYLRDGMFVYLPSVRRPRRITGTFADGALMGTTFSYFEFKQLQNAFGDLTPELEAAERVNGRDAQVLRYQAVPGAETKYSSVRAWIDAQACVVVRAEFYEGKKLSKELTSPASSIKQAGKGWYVAEYDMREAATDTHSVMKVARLDVDKAPPSQYFDPTSFFLAP